MLAAVTFLTLLPLLSAADDLSRSAISERDLAKSAKDMQAFVAAMDEDDRKEQQASLDAIQKAMDRAGKRAKVGDVLKYPGDWEYLLEKSKPIDRAIKAKIGRGFFAYVYVDQWDEDERTACLLSLPKTYGKSSEFMTAIIALRPPVGQSGKQLIQTVVEQATAMYGSLMDSTIIVIPLGPDTGSRSPNPSEMGESWASNEGIAVFFTCMKVLLESVQFDRSRLILDGWSEAGEDALRIVTTNPSWFAGVINRGGEVGGDQMLLENLTGVPMLYVHAKAEGREIDFEALRERVSEYSALMVVEDSADVTAPSAAAAESIAQWVSERRRDLVPHKIHYMLGDIRHQFVNWITAMRINRRANATPGDKDFPRIDAVVNHPGNRITIETVNVTELVVYLTDALVDLDKPVIIEVNGEVRVNKAFPRSLRGMLENRYFNNSGEYGLYTAWVRIDEIDANVPEKSP